MYRQQIQPETTLELNQATEGESIEQKIERITNNKEPISDGAPIIYTERGEGVIAGYNPRTDRFEVAIEAMDAVSKTKITQRQERLKQNTEKYKEEIKKSQGNDGEAKSTQGDN